jgi:hypothetical protein
MKSVFLFIFSFSCVCATAQDGPPIAWQISLGGSSNDTAKCVQATNDGGCIVGGTSSSNNYDVSGNHGGNDFWIVKLNSSGIIEWKKCLGGSGNETFGSIRQTKDGGFIIAGTTTSNNGDVSGNHGGSDAWVVKLTSSGNTEWQKCFGSTGDDELSYIEQTKDGGYIALGKSGTNDGDLQGQPSGASWIFKTDSLRAIQWQQCATPTPSIDVTVFYLIHQTYNEGYILYGVAYLISPSPFLEKLDSMGSSSGYFNINDPLNAIPTADSGYLVLCREWSSGFADSLTVKKFDGAYNLQWETSLGKFTGNRYFQNVNQTPDGGYIITGYTDPNDTTVPGNHGGNDYWVIKLSSNGAIQWQKSPGSTGDDIGYWGVGTSDGGYIVAGSTNVNSGDVTGNHGGNDFWVVKLSNNISVCPNTSTKTFSAGRYNAAYTYQWQIDTNNGFENIANSINYSGATSDTLTLTNTETSWYGYKYRCLIIKPDTTIITEPYILKFGVTWAGAVSNDWFNAANWSCNVLPDGNTDVIIPAGLVNYPQASLNTSVRSLNVSPGATVNVLPGTVLTIAGH